MIAPEGLSHTMGTAEILRLPEVEAAINGDFMVLPCDLVCDLPGDALLESWMIEQGSLGGTTDVHSGHLRRGGVGVWYETKADDYVKGTETDFVITTSPLEPSTPTPSASLRPNISKLLYATTTDTLRDTAQEKGGFPIRSGLIRKHRKLRMLTTHRDAHLYLFPYWVIDFIKRNEKFDTISEDVIGWWAKAGWQDGLAEKLHMDEVVDSVTSKRFVKETPSNNTLDFNIQGLTTTSTSVPRTHVSHNKMLRPPTFLSYVHPHPSAQLIRRVDTSALLLSTTLRLAALPPIETPPVDTTPNPHSHTKKLLTDPSLIAPHTTIHVPTTLIAPNTSVATHCTIKSSCIGYNCVVGEGAKIIGSLLMDNVQVESKATLQDCILGRRCVIGKNARLEGCEVQEGFRIDEGTIGSKGEKFCAFEGLDNVIDADGGSDVDVADYEEENGLS